MSIHYDPKDAINPSHYQQGSVQVFDQMLALFGTERMISHCEITAFKYRMRAGYKNDIKQDIDKALWYEAKRKELLAQTNKG